MCRTRSPCVSCVSVQSSNTSERVQRPESDAISEYVYVGVNQNLNGFPVFLICFIFPSWSCFFLPWNCWLDVLLGLTVGKQTGIWQWLGGHTLVNWNQLWRTGKKGKEGLKLGTLGSVLHHRGEGLSSHDAFIVPHGDKSCPLKCLKMWQGLHFSIQCWPDISIFNVGNMKWGNKAVLVLHTVKPFVSRKTKRQTAWNVRDF